MCEKGNVNVVPVTLEGRHVRLEPLEPGHAAHLIDAADDGELWKSNMTIVPSRASMGEYIGMALESQATGRELPFVILHQPSGRIVGSTRFYNIERKDRNAEIGYTWVAASAQRTAVNTEAKLLLLAHAFESWLCIRVSFVTDVLNQQSRAALLRLGAQEEGILRNHLIMPGGRYRDSACFSIIEAEWPTVKARLETKLAEKASETS